jgi:dolichol kinase
MQGKFIKGVVTGAVVSGLTLASTAAFAGSGIGAVFNLGKTNAVNATSVLQGSTNGQQLALRTRTRVPRPAVSGSRRTRTGHHSL